MSDKKGPDMELKKAFLELQSKMVDTRTKMKFSDMQVLCIMNYFHKG